MLISGLITAIAGHCCAHRSEWQVPLWIEQIWQLKVPQHSQNFGFTFKNSYTTSKWFNNLADGCFFLDFWCFAAPKINQGWQKLDPSRPPKIRLRFYQVQVISVEPHGAVRIIDMDVQHHFEFKAWLLVAEVVAERCSWCTTKLAQGMWLSWGIYGHHQARQEPCHCGSWESWEPGESTSWSLQRSISLQGPRCPDFGTGHLWCSFRCGKTGCWEVQSALVRPDSWSDGRTLVATVGGLSWWLLDSWKSGLEADSGHGFERLFQPGLLHPRHQTGRASHQQCLAMLAAHLHVEHQPSPGMGSPKLSQGHRDSAVLSFGRLPGNVWPPRGKCRSHGTLVETCGLTWIERFSTVERRTWKNNNKS